MKRALGLIFVIVACIIGFLSLRGTMPFMPIAGASMEPELYAGDLILIKEISPSQIKVDDIVVFNVPPMVQKAYNYPPVIAHRVIRITTFEGAAGFRTKGDNTGEDPFTVRAQDLRGKVSKQISYLGFPLLFFQSQQGLIFTIIALLLLAIFLYGSEISRGGNTLHRGIFAPVINEEKRANRALTRKIESTEQKMNSTEQALEKFAAAISEYAQHLASHTSAIQGLSEASHELKRSAAEQNKVITYLINSLEQPGLNIKELSSRAERAAREAEKPPRSKKPMPEAEKLPVEIVKPVPEAVKPTPEAEKKQSPPGCARRRQPLAT